MIECISVRWRNFINVYLRNRRVVRVEFSDHPAEEIIKTDVAKSLKRDLMKYLRGHPVDFISYDVELRYTDFVKRVLTFVRNVPYGSTVTYGQIADVLKTSPRAVGQALKRNRTPIIIPCHRVVSKRGIGGFSCGSDLKAELLKIELGDDFVKSLIFQRPLNFHHC